MSLNRLRSSGHRLSRNFSTAEQNVVVEKRLKTNQPFGVRYGPGGRSSNSGITATVFGSSGFVGRYFMNELGSCGTRVYAPYRGCELEVRHLKQMFDLGQLGLMPYSPRDKDSIIKSIQYSDVVINLIGKHYETKHFIPTRRADGSLSRINYDFDEVHVKIPETLAELSKEAGVKCFIHMSALAADENSESEWNRSKARGEKAVRSKFPEAIIVKPATVFGPEDRFLNWIAEATKRAPFFPLLNDGSARLQPVYAGDVGKALMEIIYGYEAFQGRDFQLAGPNEYTYKELAEFVSDVASMDANLVDVPVSAAKLLGRITQETSNPYLTQDMVAQLLEDVVAKPDPTLLTFNDLDIAPCSVDKVAFDYLNRFRKGGHFQLVEGYH